MSSTASTAPSVAIVMPAWNEADRIGTTIDAIAAFAPTYPAAITAYVADDGSTDRTTGVAWERAEATGLPLENLRLPHRGKALAVRDAMIKVSGASEADYLLMLDADNEVAISHLAAVEWSGDPDTIYIARRVRETGGRLGETPTTYRRLMSIGMRIASRVLLGLPYSDTQCGFKLFPRHLAFELFSQQRSSSWVFDAEILVIARQSGLPIREVPVTWEPRGQSRVGAGAAVSSVLGLLQIAGRRWARRYRRVGPPRPHRAAGG